MPITDTSGVPPGYKASLLSPAIGIAAHIPSLQAPQTHNPIESFNHLSRGA